MADLILTEFDPNQRYTKAVKIKFKVFYFIEFLSFGILGPYLALYLTRKGFTGAQIGLLLGMVPILTVLLQPVWSTLSDVLHKRRLILIIACIGVSVSMVGLGLADSFIETFLMSFLFSIFTTPIMSISTAIVLDYLDEAGKPEEFGLIRVWGSIAYAISSLLLGSLFLGQILILFPWILACVYLLLAGLSFILPESEGTLSHTHLKDLKILTANQTFMFFLLGMIFIGATLNIAINYQTLFLQSLNTSDLLVGVIISLPALLEVPMMSLVPMLLKRVSMRWLILVGAIILPVRWLLYFLIQKPGLLIPVQVLHGIATISFEVVGVSFIDKSIDKKWRATGQGLYGAVMWGIGPGIGLYVAGNVLDRFNIRGVWGLNFILGVVGLVLVFIALWRFSPPTKSPVNQS